MKYKFSVRPGYRVSADPQELWTELFRIRQECGELSTEGVVREAADADKYPALHSEIPWDDSEAAHQYRLIRARHVMRGIVRVRVVSSGSGPVQHLVHVRKADDRQGKYEPVSVVVRDVDMFQTALQELESKLSGAARAVQELREAAGQSKGKGKLAIIAIVTKALETATAALKKLAA